MQQSSLTCCIPLVKGESSFYETRSLTICINNKVGLSPSRKNCFVCYNESSLKMMEALFVLQIFKFWLSKSWLFGRAEKNGLIRKIRLFSKFFDVKTWLTNNCKHILLNISRSKSNHKMKFSQFIEYSKRNNFLQKSCRKWARETSFRPLYVV